MFRIPHRWLPRTIWSNLVSMYYDVYFGVINIFRWLPIVWFDDWIDSAYLMRMMEYKLRHDSKKFKKYGHHVGSDKIARQMLICAELLKRLHEEYPLEHWTNRNRLTAKMVETQMQYYEEYLFRLMRKHIRGWWD